jgi:hypothetical protein
LLYAVVIAILLGIRIVVYFRRPGRLLVP